MPNSSDISETQILLDYGEEICGLLLLDQTTRKNIYWATDSYEKMGEGYSFFDEIRIDRITGDNDKVIRPRAVKSKEEQTQRAKDKAEVFTPSWICNAQNNLIDEAWFGRKDVFNSPDPKHPHKWIDNKEKIEFPEDKTWKDYVADTRLEITCGEAPYLCNRYDAVTGKYNRNVKFRIGLLDRKLRVVSENAKDSKEWILWAKIALRATYGFEWQGDNLLLAREAVFFTFIEHYIAQFGEKKFNINKSRMMGDVAYIISWNLWQMDGLTFGLPGHEEEMKNRKQRDEQYQAKLKEYEKQLRERKSLSKNDMFGFDQIDISELVKPESETVLPFEQYCLIKDFLYGVNLKKATLKALDFHDKKAPKQTFESLVNNKK